MTSSGDATSRSSAVGGGLNDEEDGDGDNYHNNYSHRGSGPGTPTTLTVAEVDALFVTTSSDDNDDNDFDHEGTTVSQSSEVATSTATAPPPRPAVESTTATSARVDVDVNDRLEGCIDDDDDDAIRRAVLLQRRREREIETMMEANVALEVLESMRKVNLELEFANHYASVILRHDDCTCCQREALSSSRGRMARGVVVVVASEDADADADAVITNDDDDERTRRTDGGQVGMRRFNGGVGGLFNRRRGDGDNRAPANVVVANDDGNARRKFDGSRISRFGNTVGGFFTKQRSKNAEDDGKSNHDDDDDGGTAEPVNGSRLLRSNDNTGVLSSGYKSGDCRRDDGEFSAVHGDIGGLFRESSADNNDDYDDRSDEATTRCNAEDTYGEGKVGSAHFENTGNSNNEGPVKVDDDNVMQNSSNESVGTLKFKKSDINDSRKSGSVQSRPLPLRSMLKKKVSPCLTCGHPTCPRHSSSAFSSKNIPICQACAHLFELDFIVDIIASAASASDYSECRRRVNDMVDCYDRAKLLLSYMAVYAEDVASALEAQAARSNKVKAGSGATSIVSSIAGIVGCGILLFVPPAAVAGVPLLIASLVVSGGATAAQTGDEVVRYFSEPNRLYERMVALHGMATSLLRVKDVLSHVLLRSHHHSDGEFTEAVDEEGSTRRAELANEIKALLAKHDVTAGVSTNFGKGSKFVGRGTRYFGRVCSTAAVIPVAGGLLSAATIYFEGNELKRTLSRISEGNPCAKAEQVRTIGVELDMLPESSLVMEECRLVFELAQNEKTIRAITEDYSPPTTSIYSEDA